MMLAALVFVVAAQACFVEQLADGVCMTPPPPGTGLSDGRGWVHCMKPGIYTFHGAAVNGQTTLWCGIKPENGIGRFAPIQQTNSRLEWTRPDGVREPIPVTALYPPM